MRGSASEVRRDDAPVSADFCLKSWESFCYPRLDFFLSLVAKINLTAFRKPTAKAAEADAPMSE